MASQAAYSSQALALATALALLAAPAVARAEAEKGKPAPSLFGNIGELVKGQKDASRNASLGNQSASRLSNTLGRNSIGRGMRHIRHGRVSHNRPEVRIGYFEVVQGVLGLLAAATANNLSDVSGGRANNLDAAGPTQQISAPNFNAPSSASGSAGNSATSAAATAESWKRIASDLDTADARAAFKEIEEEYGITKKELLAELRAGGDGTALLENAKTNAEERTDALAALKEARANASSLAGLGESGGRGLASLAAPELAAEPPVSAADAAATAAGKSKRRSLRDELREKMAELNEGEAPTQELSPEVKDALAAREAEQAALRAREARAEATLFDMVHFKYAEREGMIRGWIKSPGAEERGF